MHHLESENYLGVLSRVLLSFLLVHTSREVAASSFGAHMMILSWTRSPGSNIFSREEEE